MHAGCRSVDGIMDGCPPCESGLYPQGILSCIATRGGDAAAGRCSLVACSRELACIRMHMCNGLLALHVARNYRTRNGRGWRIYALFASVAFREF